MSKKKSRVVPLLMMLNLTLFFSVHQIYGENRSVAKVAKHSYDAFSIFAGYGTGNLKFKQSDYSYIHTGLKFAWELGQNQERPYTKGATFFEIAPFVNSVTNSSSGVEVGCKFLFKRLSPLKNSFYLYLEAGVAPTYVTKGTREQSNRFNFGDEVGIGIQKFINRNKAYWLGYVFRHLSNTGTKQPNGGINTHSILVGSTFYF